MAKQQDQPRVVVIGGGITGLAAAYSLAQANRELTQGQRQVEVLLLEASGRLGGKILTTPFMGRPVDESADAFLTRVPWALDLVQKITPEVDLAPTISPAASNAFVVSTRRSTRLAELPQGLVMGVPTSLVGLFKSHIVGKKDVARMALDLVKRDDWPGPDETIGELVGRRLGSEIADAVVGPLLGSINAGDINQLEALSVAPVLATAARDGGSLIRNLRRQQASAPSAGAGAGASKTGAAAPIFASFEAGMGTLVDALAAALQNTPELTQIRTDVAVQAITSASTAAARRRSDRTLELTTADGEQISANAAVITTPTYASQRLVAAAAPTTAKLLTQIKYASVAIITLGFDRSQVRHRLDAAGMLVPAREGMLTTACSFASTKWPHWASEDQVILRASVGRYGDERAMAMSDEDLVAAVVSELAPLLGITGEPSHQRVSRWDNALPQYLKGHQSLVEQIEQNLATELPGVFLAGAGYRGLGIPACIRQGTVAAEAALAVC